MIDQDRKMARSIRIEYPGAFYHVMARGNRRENIFFDDADRHFFLETLAQACGKTGWRVHAWVLMGNHYHLLLETPEANLVNGMQWLQNTYTRRFNTRHQLWGRLFGDRYKAVPVEGEGYYYESLLDYIHLNPVRAGMVTISAGESLSDYPWSSVSGGYLMEPRKRVRWLAVQDGLQAFGCPDTVVGRRAWLERLERRAAEEAADECGAPHGRGGNDARRSTLSRGWYWGSDSFSEQLLKLGETTLKKKRHRDYRASEENRAHGEEVAHRLLVEGLAAAKLRKEDLIDLPGSDARKVAIAATIWQHTTVKMQWISDHLFMRSAANASQQIRRLRLTAQVIPEPLRIWTARFQSKNVA